MVLHDDGDDQLFKKHQEFCKKLNLDIKIVNESWESFQNIQTNFTLEGDPLHWLGCAVFVTCKKVTMPTVSDTVVHSSCVSLTSLLRHCNLSLTLFFNKITRWADMALLPEDFRQTIKRLEGSFAVSFTVFKKFTPIFNEIFKGPIETEVIKQPRNRKQRPPPCTSTKLFEFCWTLFITAKGKNSVYGEDLVMSFHLLIACCDLIFKNAYLENRKDLLNPKFSELPSNWMENNAILPKEPPCIVNYLCEKYNGTSADAKYIKEYSWKALIGHFFEKGILQGHKDNFSGLLGLSNFEINLKNITKEYEEHLLHKGDFDEKIFIAEYRRRLLLSEQSAMLTSNGSTPNSTFSIDDSSTRNSPHGDSPKQNRRNFVNKSVQQLQTLLTGRMAGPSDVLREIFVSCSRNPEERVKTIIEDISGRFCPEFVKHQNLANNLPEFPIQPEHLYQMATNLFYKLVENMFLKEKTLHKDISLISENDVFYKCTLACSLEVVLYSYCLQRKFPFPWILNILTIQPYDFVRVIELIVRSTEQLSREVVKHLNMIEQKVFECLLWKSDSPLWRVLENLNEEFPKFEDTALPGNLVYNDKQIIIAPQPNSSDQVLSPGPSAVDRFQSPVLGTLVEIKKKLFANDSSGTKHFVVVDQKGNTQMLPLTEKMLDSAISARENIKTDPVAPPPPPPVQENLGKPKKAGSIYIILRKFYNLAYARMKELCGHLEIDDMKFTQKIWTVFEHSIREHTDLMRDRHLDQLLMCAVYVVCKVNGTREKKFAEIMQYYRKQPQASNHIYRNVLITRASNDTEEKRGDLISFYNSVYVQAMKSFAVQFSSSSNQNSNPTLSPLPKLVNNNFVSPRRHVSNNLFITPYDTPTNSLNKGKILEYQFSRSPSRDLEMINIAINKGIVGKRLLTDDNGGPIADAPNKRLVTKMQSMMEQRRSHATE